MASDPGIESIDLGKSDVMTDLLTTCIMTHPDPSSRALRAALTYGPDLTADTLQEAIRADFENGTPAARMFIASILNSIDWTLAAVDLGSVDSEAGQWRGPRARATRPHRDRPASRT